jgi:ferredoxin-NADP reductase
MPEARGIRTLEALAVGFERLSARSVGHRRPHQPSRAMTLRVAAKRKEADDVVGMTLTGDGPLPPWQPGAHLDLVLPSGRQRQYSLCGDPHDRGEYRIAVRRLAAGSSEVHAMPVGKSITVRGPRNAFPFLTVPHYLFVAGGIGITPIRPMVRDAAERGADWALVYTGRTLASMPFVDDLVALGRSRVHIWSDDVDGMPDPRRILALAPNGAALYCCGPPPMIAAIRAHVPDDRISTVHYERFSPPLVVGGRPFEVELARSNQVVPVAADQSALAAIRTVRPNVAYSCQQGFCGTCHVRVLDGAPSPMAICVARATGRVVLDL